MVGGGADTTEGLRRAPVARGRPNWWVILAVSLALMALLVATAGGHGRGAARGHPQSQGAATGAHRPGSGGPGADSAGGTRHPAALPSSTTTTGAPAAALPLSGQTAGPSSLTSRAADTSPSPTPPASPAPTTTTTAPPATTTTAGAVPANRSQNEGYLDPPVATSHQYGFTGTGAMQISVLWSGPVYLTMTVSCANGGQSVGGTSAMEATLPDASGSCLATVTEPATETASLTYSITIGPPGG